MCLEGRFLKQERYIFLKFEFFKNDIERKLDVGLGVLDPYDILQSENIAPRGL